MSVMSIMKGFEDKEDLEDHQKNSDLSFSDNCCFKNKDCYLELYEMRIANVSRKFQHQL